MLVSAGVGAAAGAMIAFSFAMSPPLTLLPSRPADANGNLSLHRSVEVVDASADEFDRRSHVAIDDIPPTPVSKGKDSPDFQDSADLSMLAMVTPQVPQTEPDDFDSVPKPTPDSPVTLAVPKPPARPSDICARNGLYRIEYTQSRHRYWRCLHRQHHFSERRIILDSRTTRASNQASSGNEPQPFYEVLRGFFSQSTQ